MTVIRTETPADRQAVEDLTRRAFYNVYAPGCTEHYLVRVMRDHPDFLPELAFVLELDGQLIGNIMYTRSYLEDGEGTRREIVTFGPVSILPEQQRRGYGGKLIRHSLERATALGFGAAVIFGNPDNYVGCGFQSCKRFQVCGADGRFPAAMLVRELLPGVLDGRKWTYQGSPAMEIDEAEARRYDDGLEKLEKKRLPSQETFYILSQAFLD